MRLASEAAEFGSYDYHSDKREVYWSGYLRGLVGLAEDRPLTLDEALHYVHADHKTLVRQHIQGYAPESGRRELEFRLTRADGEVRWLLDRGQTIVDPHAPSKWRVLGTVLDITERKLAEDHQRTLMGELDHRVKNILSNVSSMARLSGRSAQSVTQFVTALESRIHALSRAHDLLRKAHWGAVLLKDLVAETLAPFHAGSEDRSRSKEPKFASYPRLLKR